MNARFLLLTLAAASLFGQQSQPAKAKRIVILKVDGLSADLLFRTMRERNPATGKSMLPWLDEIFNRHGVVFDNFFTRGISLSAPSWSMLDTGHHLIIKGNVEYDRYTGRVYDYLNFVPFYLGYARQHEVDMPGVRVLDQAGVPLLIDAFRYSAQYQSLQLFQRGIRWTTLRRSLAQSLSGKALLSVVEDPQSGLGLGEGLEKETENEVTGSLSNPQILYADLYTGDVDHLTHGVNDPRAIEAELVRVDALAGRLWNAIKTSPLAQQTVFAMVSDHGMNNVPGVYSQTFSLVDLFNSAYGGAHHVITNRHQLSQYKLRGLDPLVFRVINASTASFYLAGKANEYPTAWLDLDGNERASVGLRNSELNRIHIVLKELTRTDLDGAIRAAAARYVKTLIDAQRPCWQNEISSLTAEMKALGDVIASRQREVHGYPRRWSTAEFNAGFDKAARRRASELKQWLEEKNGYEEYVRRLNALLSFNPSETEPLKQPLSDFIPPLSLGDRNHVHDLQHYVAGPSNVGLVLDHAGNIDEDRSFRHVNYLPLLAGQTVRNNPQAGLTPHPIDFVALALDTPEVSQRLRQEAPAINQPIDQAIWLYGDEQHQLVELVARDGEKMRLRLIPVSHLSARSNGDLSWEDVAWSDNFPLRLYEDERLATPPGANRAGWLSGWHTEREWFEAVRDCQYANGIIGITEHLLPPARALPGVAQHGILGELEIQRRTLVQPDFEVFAADHWNFNTRTFNPGGNHGSFLRISTHSVWMMAGAGVPEGRHIEQPYDSLNFASTLLNLLGKTPPIPERVVSLDK